MRAKLEKTRLCITGALLNSQQVLSQEGPVDKDYHYKIAMACVDEQKTDKDGKHQTFSLLTAEMRAMFLEHLDVTKRSKACLRDHKLSLVLAHQINCNTDDNPLAKAIGGALRTFAKKGRPLQLLTLATQVPGALTSVIHVPVEW